MRAVAYVRESTEEQAEGYSPDAQRQAIAQYAARNELELVDEYLDFSSGWKEASTRPGFQRMIQDAAAHTFEVILVFHTSRFARNQVEARQYKKLLRDSGIQVISVTQPVGDDPSDPSAFLTESVWEMFDEFYSISQSFWTKAGLSEKARQGHLVGSIPWGLTKETNGDVVLDPGRSDLVLELFQRYATGEWSDRQLATWLNSTGARTTKGNLFSKDTVREMLVNAAYAGFVTSRRDKKLDVKGQFPAIVAVDLFERVQDIRALRTRTLNPGRPSGKYALSKLLFCERCGAPMHATSGGRAGTRRYQCSARKQRGQCDQPIVSADVIEDAVAEYVRAFEPPAEVRKAVARRLRHAEAKSVGAGSRDRREDLTAQLARLKDLYVFGDLSQAEYQMKKRTLEEELARLQPPPADDAADAAAALMNFGLFWEREERGSERNKLLRVMFERITVDGDQLHSVTPRSAFYPYFTFSGEAGWKERERRDSNPRPPA